MDFINKKELAQYCALDSKINCGNLLCYLVQIGSLLPGASHA